MGRYQLFCAIMLLTAACHHGPGGYTSWPVYGGSKGNIHYSSLRQVDTGNVGKLQRVWEYHTNDGDSNSQIQVNAIVVDGVLYGVSPKLKLFALDAASGRQKWVFDPAPSGVSACRGVTYYKEDHRLFYAAGSFLFCIDAVTGRPVPGFGDGGKIDLHNDLGRDTKKLYVVGTTPGIIYKDMLIVGDRVAEEAAAAPGHIRAYDVHTGKLRWIFHTIPWPGEEGYESWKDPEAYKHIGGANAWSGFSLDEEKGILFAPIGSASFDFYGGKRLGDDLFANCVVALDAATGKRIWHFQTVHHDVWDRDPPTPPVLVTVEKDGRSVEAVAQVTKSGFIFLLDRLTGRPLYPVEERKVPTDSALPGEELSPTQPFPTVLPVFARQSELFTPPSKKGTLIFPGFDGGAEWGGPSFDPETGLLYVNANEMPWILTMVDVKPKVATTLGTEGMSLYAANCMTCHGPARQGGGNYPSLIGVGRKYTDSTFFALLGSGRRMMPAFPQLSVGERRALASFILDEKGRQQQSFIDTIRVEDPYYTLPYTSTGYNKLLTKDGYPGVAPPWGTLTAIDLNHPGIVWRDTLGDYPELKAKGLHTGTENYGGSVVTAGGLLFIAATSDARMRAFNKRTGQLLWETELPAAGFATPSVYELDGRQYIVIACGGGKLHKRSGDAYVAFALPQ